MNSETLAQLPQIVAALTESPTQERVRLKAELHQSEQAYAMLRRLEQWRRASLQAEEVARLNRLLELNRMEET